MPNTNFRSTCAIATSLDLLGDKWSLLILRDMLLHKKSTFKEFLNSKEKIASNILTNRLVYLIENGFISKLNLKGTKKSARFIATRKGVCALPLLIELYLLTIEEFSKDVLNDSQIAIKAEIQKDRDLFISTRREAYIKFSFQLESDTIANQKSKLLLEDRSALPKKTKHTV